MVIHFDEEKQNKRLEELRKREEEDLAQMLSGKYGIEYLDLSTVSINTDALRLIPEAEARESKVAVFTKVGKNIGIALLSPSTDKTATILKRLEQKGFTITRYLVSNRSLEWAWRRYKDITQTSQTRAGVLDIADDDISTVVKEIKSVEDVTAHIENVLSQKKSYRVSHAVEIIIAGALALKASDIHFEPEEEHVRLRYRLDGVLVDIVTFDNETYRLLLSRIKLLSALKLNLGKRAQDGRFSIKMEEVDIEIRTSVLPGAYAESIVLRILDPRALGVPLEELGIEKHLFDRLMREISKPNGLILNTGPTGSGKTTTLYAFLKKIHKPEVKIITIENPIEYHLPGIVQTQVDPKKYTFAQGLRSALRQDPDVIMVGEIRDEETADIAINASLTGHLVFSTLHTNSAAGAFPRLIDLGIDEKILSSAINAVIAQRLVRKLCPDCKKQVAPEATDKEIIDRILSHMNGAPEGLDPNVIYTAEGCDKCNGSGYKGRIAVYEAIFMTEAIETLLKDRPSIRDIEAAADQQNTYTMQEDGIVKVLNGVTSLEELKRVLDLTKQE